MTHKTIDIATKHLEDSLSLIRGRYEDGVRIADWKTPAGSEAAEKNYADGVTKAVAAKSRQKGIAGTSNEDWKNGAMEGASIIAERIRNALPDYTKGFAPILSAMNSAADAAPPRTTDFRANINNRLVKVVEAAKRAAGKL